MIGSLKTFRIDLVDIFGPRRTCREPSALGHHFQPADGRAIARRTGEDGLDFFAGQICESNLLRRESLQQCLLLRGGRRLNAVVKRLAELAREFAVDLRRDRDPSGR